MPKSEGWYVVGPGWYRTAGVERRELGKTDVALISRDDGTVGKGEIETGGSARILSVEEYAEWLSGQRAEGALP